MTLVQVGGLSTRDDVYTSGTTSVSDDACESGAVSVHNDACTSGTASTCNASGDAHANGLHMPVRVGLCVLAMLFVQIGPQMPVMMLVRMGP